MHPDVGGEIHFNHGRLSQHKGKGWIYKGKTTKKIICLSVLLIIISAYQNMHPILNPPFKDDFLYFLPVFPGQDDPDSCYRQVPAARQQEEATAR